MSFYWRENKMNLHTKWPRCCGRRLQTHLTTSTIQQSELCKCNCNPSNLFQPSGERTFYNSNVSVSNPTTTYKISYSWLIPLGELLQQMQVTKVLVSPVNTTQGQIDLLPSPNIYYRYLKLQTPEDQGNSAKTRHPDIISYMDCPEFEVINNWSFSCTESGHFKPLCNHWFWSTTSRRRGLMSNQTKS